MIELDSLTLSINLNFWLTTRGGPRTLWRPQVTSLTFKKIKIKLLAAAKSIRTRDLCALMCVLPSLPTETQCIRDKLQNLFYRIYEYWLPTAIFKICSLFTKSVIKYYGINQMPTTTVHPLACRLRRPNCPTHRLFILFFKL